MSRQSYYAHERSRSRPSVFIDSQQPHRQSYAPQSSTGAGGGGSASAVARLQAKRQELEGLMMLKEQSARLARDVTKLGDNVDALVEGGEAVAAVMSSWAGVFRAIQIARESLATRTASEADNEASAAPYIPDTLVRIGSTTETAADGDGETR